LNPKEGSNNNSLNTNPRLVAITKFTEIAAAAGRVGSNAKAIVKAMRKRERNKDQTFSASSFLGPKYDHFLESNKGKDRTSWKQYDLIDGVTDCLLINMCDEESNVIRYIYIFI